MKVTVVPAGAKTAAATIRSLLQHSASGTGSVEIIGVYRDISKVPAEFAEHPNFQAVKGDIADASSLNFAGSDAVFTLTPPVFDGRELVEHARVVSRNVKDAAERAGSVKRLVLLSSMGAHLSEEVVSICRLFVTLS